MFVNIAVMCAAFACFIDVSILKTNIFVQGDALTPSPSNVIDSFQKHMDEFKSCLDQVLAKTVNEVSVKQVQPVFDVLGDQLNRFSKAFEDLTATKAPS
ncbi:uncharacterized protein LOC134755450 isoform X1 [Cydia strobilella]|uniref:uncharacterized protein LOC134755450 isoform X1 n=1 Tax=Cydia strobilella TaxID=1100964 RepID=UPI003007632C